MRDGVVVMRATLLSLLVVAACAPRPAPITPDHPASPSAEAGRTVGAPAALRPGVATLEDPAPNATDHAQRGSGAAPGTDANKPPAMDHSQHGGGQAPATDAGKSGETAPKVDTIKNTPSEPSRVDPEKANPQDISPEKGKAPAKKPAKKPAQKQPAKPAPKPDAKQPAPMPPMDHSGHGAQ